ncbi:PspC domain-containing protein [Dactylosporangium sp. NPDC049742]|uniref:PspC domain-containing protein n=1 Tax=Dactylosporangium sp. NPDC049742 TaxID=3154737 RepID=UPI00343C52AC
MTEIKRLRRSRADRTLAGVVGGLAEYFGVDPTMARAVFLLAVLLTGGTAVLAYPILWIVMPDTPPEVRPVSPASGGHLPYGA